jgi:hypothetical protein
MMLGIHSNTESVFTWLQTPRLSLVFALPVVAG